MADSDRDENVASDATLPAVGTPTPGRTPTPSSGARRGPLAYQSGDLVAERYRITRPIGEGGMGEVYEAEDLLLKERVALKTLRDPVADDETTVLRFKREIQLARRVTHPNVCRIFDVGLDRRGGRESAFLTMELLAGETLAARLKRGGPMAPAEALPFAEQIASALSAAHGAGIIHRDLKCANVLLVDGPPPRAVVTDFGLARVLAEGADQVTGDGGIVGSPAYMAPEQVEGGRRLTAATDLYAFGVVLFEMVTGKLPFVGETPLATAVKRVKEAAPSPRVHTPGLDVRWERTILHCMARLPEDRPASAADVIRSLRGEIVPPAPPPEVAAASPPAPAAARGSRRSTLLVVALALGAIFVVRELRNSQRRGPPDVSGLPVPPPPPSPPVPGMRPAPPVAAVAPRGAPRRTVAILGFRNLGGQKQYDYISTAIAEMLSTELMASEELRVIPGESVARAKRKLSLVDAERYAGDTLEQLRGLLDVDEVVTGSYLVSGGEDERVRFDLHVQNTSSADSVASVSENGDLDDLAELVSGMGEELRGQLHVEEPSESEREGARALLPRRTDVARMYSEGVALQRVGACGAARGPLEQAVGADPSFAMAREALSDVLFCLGYEGRALEEAQKAVELSKDLPVDVRRVTEARVQFLAGDFGKAKQTYAELFRDNPDNYDYGLRLLRLQKYDEPAEARSTLAQLRKLVPATESPELDLVEVRLQPEKSIEARLAALEKARQHIEEQGARLLAAEALLNEWELRVKVGQLDGALDAARRAKEIYQASGDKDGVILALSAEAVVAQVRGDAKEVRRLLDQATELASQIDSVRSIAVFYTRVGEARVFAGDLRGAREMFEGAVRKLRAKPSKPLELAKLTGELALVYVYEGDAKEATDLVAHGLEEARHAGDRTAEALYAYGAAQLALIAGENDTARKMAAEAVGGLELLAKAGATLVIEAAIALHEGRFSAAEPLARKTLTMDEAGDHVVPFLREEIYLEALLRQGKVGEARAFLDKQGARPGRKQPFFSQLMIDTYAARLRAASRRPADQAAAIADLDAISTRAEKAGFRLQALFADLARGRVERAAGRPAATKTLAKVAHEAERRGFGQLAIDAQQALEDQPAR